MSQITLEHRHGLADADARTTLDRVADGLRRRYDMQTAWHDDRLRFWRSGVEGSIALQPGCLRLEAALQFPLSLMQARIEREIRDEIARRFGSG